MERRAWRATQRVAHHAARTHTHTHTHISRSKLYFTWVPKHTTVIHLSGRVRD